MVKQPNFGTFELLNKSASDPKEAIVFIAQLFAWAYLSQKYQKEIQPNIFDIDLETIDKDQLRKHLVAIGELQLSESISEELKLFDGASETRKELREQARRPMALKFNLTLFDKLSDGDLESVLTQVNRITLLTLIPYETIAAQFKQALMALDPKMIAGWWGPPTEVASLMCGLAMLSDQDTVYCPHALSYQLAEFATEVSNNVHVELFEARDSGVAFRPFYIANMLKDSKIHLGCPITPSIPAFISGGKAPAFTKTICVLPWGRKIGPLDDLVSLGLPKRPTSEEIFYIRHALGQSSGTAVFLVSNSVLFRSGIEEQKLRQDLVDEGILKAVIRLPEGLFPGAGIGTSIIVVDKDQSTGETTFIDASAGQFHQKTLQSSARDKRLGANQLTGWESIIELAFTGRSGGKFLSKANSRDIALTDYNLLPNRYVLDPAERQFNEMVSAYDLTTLGDIADITRAQALKGKEVDDIGSNFLEVRLSDIQIDGSLKPPFAPLLVPSDKVGRAKKMVLDWNDILLSVKGTVGVVAIFNAIPGPVITQENIVPSQSFVIIRLNRDARPLTPMALYGYLASDLVQGWLKTRSTGATMKSLSNKDLRSLPVPIVSNKFVDRVESNYENMSMRSMDLKSLQEEVKLAQGSMWPQDEAGAEEE